jgi:hypothetical protein
LALPASLAKVAAALGLEQQKDDAGRRLMMQMARPRHPRKGEDEAGIYWFDDQERLGRLYAYCKQDVETERAIHKRIGHLPDAEQKVWLLDAVINDRGIMVDRRMVEGAIKIGTAAQREINAELRKVTGSAVENISQVERLMQWLGKNYNGIWPDDVGKETVTRMLTQTDLSAEVRRVLELRLAGAHISAIKFKAMLNWAGNDGRIRGALKYHAAATGRWASYGTQLQNIKKPPKDLDLAEAIKLISAGSYAEMKKRYDNPLRVVGESARAALVAAPGHRYVGADFSGIESRVLAFLAGEQTKLDMWAKFDQTGAAEDEPYFLFGKSYGFPDDAARSPGKTSDLAFGYMGGIGAWRKFAGDEMPDEQVDRIKRAWRNAHPETVKLWTALDTCARRAVANPNTVQRVNQHLAFRFDGTFLHLKLPSGRKVAYPFARLDVNPHGEMVVHFKDSTKGAFLDCRGGWGAWPGLWIENAVQAVARDLLVEAMQRLEAAGYSVVITVHDEIVCEMPEGVGSKDEFLAIMTQVPAWAEGLPIAAKGRNGPRYVEVEPKDAHVHLPPDDVTVGDILGELDTEPEPEVSHEKLSDQEPPEQNCSKGEQSCSTNGSGHSNGHDWAGYASGEREWGDDAAEYIYRDMRGEPYLKVKRTSKKQFPQYHYENGKWISGKPTGPKIPYRLPELMAAPLDAPVFICEGEKDAGNVALLGLVATANSGGAGKFTAELASWFTGRKTVYVLEDNDDAGRAHARMVKQTLKGVVDDVRIVSFPDLDAKGDVSDWLDQGHTKDELLARCKAAPVGGHALDVRNIGDLTTKPTPRGWLLGVSFCRKFLSQLQGDGGVGKTSLRYAQYLSMASGRSLTGEYVHHRCRVLVLSLEDDVDELERRLWAAMIHHKLDRKELDGWLYYQALGRDAGKIKTLDEKGRVVDGQLAVSIEQTVVALKIDVVGIDPFVKTHDVGENNNDAIDSVAQVLTDMSHKHDISVDAPHHVSKGQADPGNAQKGRGASALVDAARLVYTLTPMSDVEAKGFGIKEEDRRSYIRLDKGKVNTVRPARVAKWFELVGVSLGNGNELYPNGDEVQTVEPWTPPDAMADFDADLQNAILNDIEKGMDNGQRYSASAKADKRAGWKVVIKHCPDKTKEQAQKIIGTWVKSGALYEATYDDPVERKERTGLRFDTSKRPS